MRILLRILIGLLIVALLVCIGYGVLFFSRLRTMPVKKIITDYEDGDNLRSHGGIYIKIMSVLLIIILVLGFAAYLIDNRKIHPSFELCLSFRKESNTDIHWLCIKENGFVTKEVLIKELDKALGGIPGDIVISPDYSYIILYGGVLVDMEYPKHTIRNWILFHLFGKNQYDSSYGKIYVRKDKQEIANIYMFKECPFEQDIHTANSQMIILDD